MIWKMYFEKEAMVTLQSEGSSPQLPLERQDTVALFLSEPFFLPHSPTSDGEDLACR